MSKLIAIEGIDGAGKSTQVEAVAKELEENGLKVKTFGFPNKEHPIGELIYRILHGEVQADRLTLELLHTADKYNMYHRLHSWLEKYDVVLLDRYIVSQTAYALSSGLSRVFINQLQSSAPYLRATSIMIDIHPNLGAVRQEGKGLDKYEADIDMQERVRRWMTHLIPLEYRIDGDREPEEITKDIVTLIYSAPDVM